MKTKPYKNEFRFQSRLHLENDADVIEIIQQMRKRRMKDREILVMAIRALDGWSLDEMAEITTPAGALRRLLEQVLKRFRLATVDDVEGIVSEALSNVTLHGGGESKSMPRGKISTGLADMLGSFDDEDE